jgi:NitT/TauT family transport system substrate-binding protein
MRDDKRLRYVSKPMEYQMHSASRRSFLARSTASAAALAVAGLPALRPASAQGLAPINVAAIPSDISGSAYYAAANGYFKKAGLEATFGAFTSGAAIAAAVISGSADVGYSNVISLAIAHVKGLPVTILVPANLHVHEAPTAGLLAVKADSPIKTAKDFNGKIIAVIGLNNIADIAAREWIDKNGGDSKTVKSVELPFSTMKAALEAGRIDGASLDTTGDPILGKPGDTLRLVGSTFDAISPHFAPSVWFSTKAWVAKNPGHAKAFVAAMREAGGWANTHHRESAEILAKYARNTAEQIDRFTRVTYGEKLPPELIQPNIDAAAKYGVIPASFPARELISSVAG